MENIVVKVRITKKKKEITRKDLRDSAMRVYIHGHKASNDYIFM